MAAGEVLVADKGSQVTLFGSSSTVYLISFKPRMPLLFVLPKFYSTFLPVFVYILLFATLQVLVLGNAIVFLAVFQDNSTSSPLYLFQCFTLI